MLKRFRKVGNNMKEMRMMCPECGSDRIARNIGEVCCRKCGLIIDENIMM
jgi:ribosomal protein L37AE/L43A